MTNILPCLSQILANLTLDPQSDDYLASNESYAAFLEVDLLFPPEIHGALQDFVPAPELVTITQQELSAKSITILTKNNIEASKYKSAKLVGHYFPRKNYVLHSNLLTTYVKLGVQVKKIHKILKFVQAPILADWIKHCTKMRIEATNNNDIFGKKNFKLVVNASYGKMIENLFNRLNCKVTNNQSKMLKLLSNPYFHSARMINESMLAVTVRPKQIVMSRPTIMGVSILALSKDFMYNYYYNTLKKNWKEKVKLLYTDTDSFIVSLKTKNINNALGQIKSTLDTSNFYPEHSLYSKENQGVLFKLKIEHAAHKLVAFCGLASKSYAVLILEDKKQLKFENEKKLVSDFKIDQSGVGLLVRGKGIHKNVLNEYNFKNYLHALKSDTSEKCIFTQMSSKKHVVHICRSVKTSLNPLCSKRYLKNCNIHSLPFGHIDCEKECNCNCTGAIS